MSGITNKDERQRRYQRMLQKMSENSAAGSVAGSMYLDNTAQTSYYPEANITQQTQSSQQVYQPNSTNTAQQLSTQQFYHPNSNTTQQTQPSEQFYQPDSTNRAQQLSTQQFYHPNSNTTQQAQPLQQFYHPNFNTAQQAQSTQQFYQNANATQRLDLPYIAPPGSQGNAPSLRNSVYTMSEASSIYKMPQTTRNFSVFSHFKPRLHLLFDGLKRLEDKHSLRLLVRLMEVGVSTMLDPPFPMPVDHDYFIDYVSQAFKLRQSKNCGNSVPQSISGLPSTSNQSQFLDSHASSSSRASSVVMEKPGSYAQLPQPRVVVNNIEGLLQNIRENTTLNNQQRVPPQHVEQENTTLNNQQRLPPQHQEEEHSKKRGRPRLTSRMNDTATALLDNSSMCLFTESVIAQRRDEDAAQQKSLPRKVVNTRNSDTPMKVQSFYPKEENVASLKCDSTRNPIKNVTRAGRQIRSPVTFWKGNESKINDTIIYRAKPTPKVELNSSMTLRNHKVIDKKPTPPQKAAGKDSAKNTPLTTIQENKTNNKTVAKKPQNKRKSVTNEDKENSTVVKTQKVKAPKKTQTSSQKMAKKQLEKVKKDNSLSQNKKYVAGHDESSENDQSTSEKKASKTNVVRKKKADSAKQVKQKSTNTAPRKRKSKGQDETIPKKKKVEDAVSSSENDPIVSSDDELFGPRTYKKTIQPASQALSPSQGMLSAKKAAGQPLGKETPPCKILGEMMSNNSCHSLASSVMKDAPVSKPNKVVKRATKIVEKNQKKAAQKPAAKTTSNKSKNDSLQKMLEQQLNSMKTSSSYSATTPVTATYTMFRGTEPDTDDERDDSDYDEDDDLS